MEQYMVIALVVVPLLSFFVGFSFGQRSVKIVWTRTETLKSSDSLTVQRTVEDKPENPYTTIGIEPGKVFSTSIVPPPEYRDLVEKWQKEQEGNS